MKRTLVRRSVELNYSTARSRDRDRNTIVNDDKPVVYVRANHICFFIFFKIWIPTRRHISVFSRELRDGVTEKNAIKRTGMKSKEVCRHGRTMEEFQLRRRETIISRSCDRPAHRVPECMRRRRNECCDRQNVEADVLCVGMRSN